MRIATSPPDPTWMPRLSEIAHCLECGAGLRYRRMLHDLRALADLRGRDCRIGLHARRGFDLFRFEDVSRDAAGFWKLSVAYSRVLREERAASIAWQSTMFDAYLDGGLRDLLLGFRRRR